MEFVVRFLLGGLAVCLFAAVGEISRPKSFAGVFGAAPSVALATLALTLHASGARYAALEARSMVIGAIGIWVYACVCRGWFWRGQTRVIIVTLVSLTAWLAIAVAGGILLARAQP
jgi:hypothetical protein